MGSWEHVSQLWGEKKYSACLLGKDGKIRLESGGTDTYKNLIYLTDEMHKLVHGSNEINKISNNMKAYIRGLDEKQIKRLNKYRKIAGNNEYDVKDLL